MNITVAKSAGFCFGVRRAIKIALDASSMDQQVEMLGDLVHNEVVVSLVEKAGIKKINSLVSGKNKALLIRAHGEGKKVVEMAVKVGYSIVDATCPMVKEIHLIAEKFDSQGYTIIIIGDRKHDEVRGIVGQIKSEAVLIDRASNIPFDRIDSISKAVVIVQSTQTTENVEQILNCLDGKIKELKYFNTICKPTRKKQQEIKKMPVTNDVVFVIGSKTSANTKRLYEISKALNTRTYWICSDVDIQKQWLEGAANIGIAAGASTPEETIQKVVAYLEDM